MEEEKKEQTQLYGTGYLDRYQESQAALDKHLAAKPGDYQSKYQPAIDKAMAAIADRKPFQYNVNADALYKQYRDRYVNMGKQAMQGAMGQAAALTGGYGSSYSQNVGQQAYDQYMTALTDKIPELYQLALQKYERDAQADKEKYSLYRDADNTDYSRWNDKLTQWSSDRAYLAGRVDTELGQAMNVGNALYSRLTSLAAAGYVPSAEELRAAGMTQAQWNAIVSLTAAAGGGGGGGGGRGYGGRSSGSGGSGDGGTATFSELLNGYVQKQQSSGSSVANNMVDAAANRGYVSSAQANAVKYIASHPSIYNQVKASNQIASSTKKK